MTTNVITPKTSSGPGYLLKQGKAPSDVYDASSGLLRTGAAAGALALGTSGLLYALYRNHSGPDGSDKPRRPPNRFNRVRTRRLGAQSLPDAEAPMSVDGEKVGNNFGSSALDALGGVYAFGRGAVTTAGAAAGLLRLPTPESPFRDPAFTTAAMVGGIGTTYGMLKLKQFIDSRFKKPSDITSDPAVAKAYREFNEALIGEKNAATDPGTAACIDFLDGLDKQASISGTDILAVYGPAAALGATWIGNRTYNLLNKFDPKRIAQQAQRDAARRQRFISPPRVRALSPQDGETPRDLEDLSDDDTLVVSIDKSNTGPRSKTASRQRTRQPSDLPFDLFDRMNVETRTSFQKLASDHGTTTSDMISGWNAMPVALRLVVMTSPHHSMATSADLGVLTKMASESVVLLKMAAEKAAANPANPKAVTVAQQAEYTRQAIANANPVVRAQLETALKKEGFTLTTFSEALQGRLISDNVEMTIASKFGDIQEAALGQFYKSLDKFKSEKPATPPESGFFYSALSKLKNTFATSQLDAIDARVGLKSQAGSVGFVAARTANQQSGGLLNAIAPVMSAFKSMNAGQWAAIGGSLLAFGTGHPLLGLIAMVGGIFGPQLFNAVSKYMAPAEAEKLKQQVDEAAKKQQETINANKKPPTPPEAPPAAPAAPATPPTPPAAPPTPPAATAAVPPAAPAAPPAATAAVPPAAPTPFPGEETPVNSAATAAVPPAAPTPLPGDETPVNSAATAAVPPPEDDINAVADVTPGAGSPQDPINMSEGAIAGAKSGPLKISDGVDIDVPDAPKTTPPASAKLPLVPGAPASA